MDELLCVFALPVCMAACLCPLVSMCSHPSICPCICFSVCLFIYMPCFSVLVACVYTYSVCSPLWVQFHPYCNVKPPSGSVFLLSFLVNPSRTSPKIQTIGAIVSNCKAIKLNFPWRMGWWWWWWWGHFEVQMFLSHALLSEAVGCVGNVL